MLIQFYKGNKMLRMFPDRNSNGMFDVNDVDGRKLDALGLPRIEKRSGWTKTSWGWEIEGEFSFTPTEKG